MVGFLVQVAAVGFVVVPYCQIALPATIDCIVGSEPPMLLVVVATRFVDFARPLDSPTLVVQFAD